MDLSDPNSDPDPHHLFSVYIDAGSSPCRWQENMHVYLLCTHVSLLSVCWCLCESLLSVLVVVDCWSSTLYYQVLFVNCRSLLSVIYYCWLLSIMCRLLIVDHRRRSTSLVATVVQGVTKRCRLSWLTSSVLVYEPKCGGMRGVAGSQPTSTAVYRSPNKLWRSNSIFNLCCRVSVVRYGLMSVAACYRWKVSLLMPSSGFPASVWNRSWQFNHSRGFFQMVKVMLS